MRYFRVWRKPYALYRGLAEAVYLTCGSGVSYIRYIGAWRNCYALYAGEAEALCVISGSGRSLTCYIRV